jgi:uncharacterized membrane protein
VNEAFINVHSRIHTKEVIIMAVDANTGLALVLAAVLGTLAAIVYSLRILVLLERRIAKIDIHIEHLVKAVMREELKIEQEEKIIEKKLGVKKTKK